MRIKRSYIGIAFIITLLLAVVPAPAAADQYVGGIPLETVKEGTVSGGLWHDSFVGTAPVREATKQYSLPDYTEIKWARLYVTVYCGHMQNNYEHRATVKFNGGSGMQTLGVEELRKPYSYPIYGGDGPVWVNDHCNRVTSDYVMWYDVTNRITARNPVAEVMVDQPEGYKGTLDGRIKLVTLVVAYDDGDDDEVYYWVNQGHDVHSYYVEDIGETYIGETTFGTEDLPEDDERIPAAEFSAIYLASNVGEFEFNAEPLDANPPQGAYSGYQIWDVSDLLEPGTTSTFTYTRDLGVAGSGGNFLGAFFKIPLALLSVREEVGSIQVTSTPAGATVFLDDEATRWTTNTTIPGISAGDHSVRVELDRYRVPDDRWVTVTEGANTTVHFTLEPITGSIEVTSDPPGAWVYLDEEDMSVATPAILENLIVGNYTVKVKAEGYDDYYRTVTVSEGETTSVNFDFTTSGGGDGGSDGGVPDYGYTGKGFDVAVSGTLHGNLTYYEFSDYTGLIHAGENREFTIDVPTPANGTIRYARLYIYTTWGHDEKRKEGTPVRISLAVDGKNFIADRVYNDRKDEGIYNYLLETHAFNVTGVPGGIAGEHVVKLTNDGRKDDVFAAYGVGLLVVTEDPAEPEMTYWIAEGSDTIYANPDFGTTSEDCITTAVFNESIALSGTAGARVILVATAGSGMDDDEHRIYFNDGEWFNLLTAGSSAISVADLDVRPYLRGSENAGGIQSLITTTKGDYMENRALILAVWKGTPPEGYEANATSTTGTPGTPAASGESSSRFTLNATSGRIEATRLIADGGAVQVYIPEGAVITEGAGLISTLTLQRLLPGDAGGADPAYAVGSEDMKSDLPLRLVISVSKSGGVIARYDRSSGTWQTLETTADAAGSVSTTIRQGGIYAVRHGETGESAPDGLLGLFFSAVQAFFGLFGFTFAGEEAGPAVVVAESVPDPGLIPAEPTPTASPAVDITTMRFDLSVLSDPPGALIDLDGEYTGRTTPAAFEALPGGTHTVRVRVGGAEPVEREIQLARDDEVVVEVPGGASPGLLRTWEQNHYGGVYIDSYPAGAEIFIDGRKVTQRTPAVIYGLKVGLHTIKVKKEGTTFSTGTNRVWIDKNVMARVTFSSGNPELARSITFESEEYAQKPFSINGRYLGDRLPKTVEVEGIGRGAYLTVMDGESYRTHRISTAVESNDTVKATFSAVPCGLLVTSTPAGAAISIDGFPTKFSTPYLIENISEGKHLVSVSKPGYVTAEREVLLAGSSGGAPAKFTLEPYAWGSLSVSSTPAGARIYLYGRDTGEVTPHTFHYLGIGSYTVKVTGKEGSKTIEDVLISPYTTTECHAGLSGK